MTKLQTPLPRIDTMTDEELDAVAVWLPLVEAWAKAVRNEIEERLVDGSGFSNARLGKPRAMTTWSQNEKHTRRFLSEYLDEDEYAPRVLITPARAKELLGEKLEKEDADYFITVNYSKPSFNLKPSKPSTRKD